MSRTHTILVEDNKKGTMRSYNVSLDEAQDIISKLGQQFDVETPQKCPMCQRYIPNDEFVDASGKLLFEDGQTNICDMCATVSRICWNKKVLTYTPTQFETLCNSNERNRS